MGDSISSCCSSYLISLLKRARASYSKGFTTFSLHERGFTLVELMVVISIIAILAVVAFTIFTGVQRGARDAKRRADVESMAKAYETNMLGGKYQSLSPGWFASGDSPKPPTASEVDYFYETNADGSGFRVCTLLGDNSGQCNKPTDANCYCIDSQQGVYMPGPTSTPVPTATPGGATDTPIPTATNTPIPTNTPTATPSPTPGGSPQTLNFQEGDGGAYSSTQDTYLDSRFPDTATSAVGAPSTNVDLFATNNPPTLLNILIRFPSIFGLNPGQIPPGKTITSATLTVTVWNTSVNAMAVHQMMESWDETTATWNSRGGSYGNWTTAGAYSPSSNSTTVATFTPTLSGVYTVDVTTVVASWEAASGTNNFGFFLEETGADGMHARSREYGVQVERPKLTVTYQ